MSQTKAQLVAPVGVVTATAMTVSGVLTATTYDGNITGAAVSIAQGNNLNVGVLTASGISGDITGSATSITQGNNVTFGSLTASRLWGNLEGNAVGNALGDALSATVTGVTTSNNISVGVVTATNFLGDGTNLTGTLGNQVTPQTVPDNKTYSIDVTASGSSNYTLSGTDRNGSVSGSDPTVTVEIGDTLNFVVDASGHPFYIRVSDGGANVSTPAATNQGSQSGTVSWTPNTAGTYYYQCGNHAGMIGTITVRATTTIDLSEGNLITFNQTANTTVAFANTSNGYVYLIRKKDITDTARTITWPTGIGWSGGSEPTLDADGKSVDIIKLVTRDEGVTWDAKLAYNDNASAMDAWVWGGNYYGGLGLNETDGGWPNYETSRSSPTQLPGKWRNVDPYETNTVNVIAVRNDSSIWAWGSQEYGQLGLNASDNVRYSSPVQIGTENTWREGWACSYMGMGLKTDGTLWGWGRQQYNGMLGQNSTVDYSSPVQIPGDWGQDKLHFGGFTAFAIKTNGQLWAWGNNQYGQLGLNQTWNPSSVPGYRSSPTQIGTDTNWERINGGEKDQIFGYKTDGSLWMWGKGDYGNLGLNDRSSRSSPTQIPGTWATSSFSSTQGMHGNCLAIKGDGTLWAWGSNAFGCLGLNSQWEYEASGLLSSPTQVGTDTTWLKVSTGGYNNPYRSTTTAIKTDGTLWIWGANSFGGFSNGNLGLNSPNQNNAHRSSPCQVGTATNWTKIRAANVMVALSS